MPTRKQKLASLNNANYFEFLRAVLLIMNISLVIEANPAEMRLLCVAAVIHWDLETAGVLIDVTYLVLSFVSNSRLLASLCDVSKVQHFSVKYNG